MKVTLLENVGSGHVARTELALFRGGGLKAAACAQGSL